MSATALPFARRIHPTRLLLLLFAFALRVVGLDRLGLAYDEAASALMAWATPQEIIIFHWNAAFEHPPVWVLLLHGWSQLVGQSEFALRLLPAFAGTLAVIIIWRLVRTIWPDDPRLATLSALLIALSPVLVYYSQEARMYTLVVLLILVSIYLMLRLSQQPQWKWVIAFWGISWFMLGLHYYAALALAIQAAVLGLEGFIIGPTRRLPWGMLLIAYSGALLPLLGWMLFSPGFQTTLAVVLDKASENPVSWQVFLGDLWRELSFGAIRWQPDSAVWGYAVAPLVALGALFVAIHPRHSQINRLGAWLLLALVLTPILMSTIFLRTLAPRYILWVVPLFYVLTAFFASAVWRRYWLAGMMIFFVVVGVDTLALNYYFGPYRKSEYREMTAFLQNRGNPEREILLLEAPRQHLLAKYYLPTQWEVHPMPTLPLPDYWPVTAPLIVPEDEDDRLLAWLTQREGVWVSYTSEAEVDGGEFLAKYLTAVSYRQQCTQWLDMRLCHYVSPHHVVSRQLSLIPILFGNELALTGARWAFYHPTADTTNILMQLDWHAQHKPTTDYKVSLRFIASDGNRLKEVDDFPIGPLLVPTTWSANDRKPGYFVIELPSELSTGRYLIQIVLYDANTLQPTPSLLLTGAATLNRPIAQPRTLAVLQIGDTMELLSPVMQ